MYDGGGFDLNNVSGENIPGATSCGSRQLKVIHVWIACMLSTEWLGIGGWIYELNTTFISGNIEF